MSAGYQNFLNFKAIAGSLSDVSVVDINGRNSAISSSEETVWDLGATYAQLTNAVAFEILSGSVNDTSAGTGARTVTLDLVDGSYNQTTTTVTMNGTTAVAISGTYIACNRIRVATAGSTLTNAGNITVRTVSGSVAKRYLPSGASITSPGDNNFIYTIPTGYVGILSSINFSVTGATDVLRVFLKTYDSTGITQVESVAVSGIVATGLNQGSGSIEYPLGGKKISGSTLLELRAMTAGAGGGDFFANAQLMLIKTTSSTYVNSLGF